MVKSMKARVYILVRRDSSQHVALVRSVGDSELAGAIMQDLREAFYPEVSNEAYPSLLVIGGGNPCYASRIGPNRLSFCVGEMTYLPVEDGSVRGEYMGGPAKDVQVEMLLDEADRRQRAEVIY